MVILKIKLLFVFLYLLLIQSFDALETKSEFHLCKTISVNTLYSLVKDEHLLNSFQDELSLALEAEKEKLQKFVPFMEGIFIEHVDKDEHDYQTIFNVDGIKISKLLFDCIKIMLGDSEVKKELPNVISWYIELIEFLCKKDFSVQKLSAVFNMLENHEIDHQAEENLKKYFKTSSFEKELNKLKEYDQEFNLCQSNDEKNKRILALIEIINETYRMKNKVLLFCFSILLTESKFLLGRELKLKITRLQEIILNFFQNKRIILMNLLWGIQYDLIDSENKIFNRRVINFLRQKKIWDYEERCDSLWLQRKLYLDGQYFSLKKYVYKEE